MTSFSANNHTNWGDPRYDALIKKGAMETNPEKRRQIYLEAQKLLTEEAAPAIPIYSYVDHYLINARVQGFQVNPLSRVIFRDVVIQ
jgi:oligopeptide transport system substrate-binding protein